MGISWIISLYFCEILFCKYKIFENRCVQCTPAHNPREREGVSVCIERKKN